MMQRGALAVRREVRGDCVVLYGGFIQKRVRRLDQFLRTLPRDALEWIVDPNDKSEYGVKIATAISDELTRRDSLNIG